MMATADLTFEKGLPASVDTERLVLGSILLNDAVYLQVAGVLSPEDFSLEKHRRIYGRMRDLYDRGERIDRVTLAEELMKQGQLESVDGLSYLVSLDDGLPEITNLDSYVRIVKRQGHAAQADLQLAADHRPLPDGRRATGQDPGRRPKNRC